jgi:hypothetical protein
MRKYHAREPDSWPRRKRGDLIFESTNEAIYYAHAAPDKMVKYNKLKTWRRMALQDAEACRNKKPLNYDRLFDLVVRAQLFRECFEEIERINEGIK